MNWIYEVEKNYIKQLLKILFARINNIKDKELVYNKLDFRSEGDGSVRMPI